MAAPKYNVRTQYAAWVGVATFATVVALSAVQVALEIKSQRADLRDRAEIAVQTLAKLAAPTPIGVVTNWGGVAPPTGRTNAPAGHADWTNQFSRVFLLALTDEQVASASVVDSNDQPIAAITWIKNNPEPWVATAPILLVTLHTDRLLTNQLGRAEVQLTSAALLTNVWRVLSWNLLVGAIMVAAGVGIAFVAAVPVQRALRELVALVTRVASGESRGEWLESDLAEVEDVSRVLTDVVARVEDAQQEVARTEKELRAAQKEMDEYTYVISHDLKEPLRGIEAFSGFLVERYRDKLDDQGRHWLDVIRHSTVRMKRLIDDLLKFSRLGQQKKPMELTGLNSMLMHVRLNLQYRLDEKKAELLVEKLPMIVCEPTAMAEVFHNLISNALKYNDKSRPIIEVGCVEQAQPQTRLPEYVFHVRDNGQGIKPEHFDKIFQLFQRLQKDDEGTGIGLTIVKRIIEWHGGRIWVESEYGQGTTFYFSLPKREVTKEGTIVESAAPPPAPPAEGDSKLAANA